MACYFWITELSFLPLCGSTSFGYFMSAIKESYYVSSEPVKVSGDCRMHVEHYHTACEKFVETRVVHLEPLITTLTPDSQWLGIHLFHHKRRDYIIGVNYYSWFPEILSLESTSTAAVITVVENCFACFGIPDIVRTSNGSQFASQKFADFAKKYGFQHARSSWFPQSNGKVECMVCTVKDFLYKSDDPYLALLSYRNTPGGTGASPAQLLMGRRLQIHLPILSVRLATKIPSCQSFRRKDEVNKGVVTRNSSCRHNSGLLVELQPGEDVWMKELKCNGKVLSSLQGPETFVVQMPRGVLHLHLFAEHSNVITDSTT